MSVFASFCKKKRLLSCLRAAAPPTPRLLSCVRAAAPPTPRALLFFENRLPGAKNPKTFISSGFGL
jgi:hypothetical protein